MGRPRKDAGEYAVTISNMGSAVTETGVSFADAFAKHKARPVKGRVIVTCKRGDSSKDRVMPSPIVNRLLNGHGLMRDVALKQLSALFV